MRVEQRIKEIPAHKERQTVYIACDGLEFVDKLDCHSYELKLSLKDSPVIQNAIFDAESFDGYDASLFFIENSEDVEIVKGHMSADPWMKCDFNLYGPGWYIWMDESGDYLITSLMNYAHYVKEHESDHKRVVDWNQKRIDRIAEKNLAEKINVEE